jgi:hypothetical protein
MRISVSLFGPTVGSTACKDVATMTQPLEAGSASCRVIFVVQFPPRGGHSRWLLGEKGELKSHSRVGEPRWWSGAKADRSSD